MIEYEYDTISHPAHYCEGRKYEPKDVIYDWDLDFFLGSAVKYIARSGRKPGNTAEQDLKKAVQYINFELEAMKTGTAEKGASHEDLRQQNRDIV